MIDIILRYCKLFMLGVVIIAASLAWLFDGWRRWLARKLLSFLDTEFYVGSQPTPLPVAMLANRFPHREALDSEEERLRSALTVGEADLEQRRSQLARLGEKLAEAGIGLHNPRPHQREDMRLLNYNIKLAEKVHLEKQLRHDRETLTATPQAANRVQLMPQHVLPQVKPAAPAEAAGAAAQRRGCASIACRLIDRGAELHISSASPAWQAISVTFPACSLNVDSTFLPMSARC